MADLAERAGVSEKTVQRLEKGDPGVGVGTLAAILAALGDPGGLERVLRPEDDPIGLSRAIETTPQRGRSSRRKAAGGRAGEADAPSGGDASRGASSDEDGVGF
jgi:transcriptional regulator with XRE-family HTH domain